MSQWAGWEICLSRVVFYEILKLNASLRMHCTFAEKYPAPVRESWLSGYKMKTGATGLQHHEERYWCRYTQMAERAIYSGALQNSAGSTVYSSPKEPCELPFWVRNSNSSQNYNSQCSLRKGRQFKQVAKAQWLEGQHQEVAILGW